MQGLSMAMRSGGADIRVFGLADDGLGDDRASWSDIPVHAARISGPRAFGYAGDLYQAVLSSQLDVLHVLCSWMYPSVVCLRWGRETRRPVIVSGSGSFDPWALANSRWKKRIAESLYGRRHLRRAACIHALCEAEALALRDYGLRNPICISQRGRSAGGGAIGWDQGTLAEFDTRRGEGAPVSRARAPEEGRNGIDPGLGGPAKNYYRI